MHSYAVPAPTFFYPKHMFPNPVVLFTYPPTSLRLKFRTIFVMTSVVQSFLFEESQTLSWFVHVYGRANTCNIASTGVNEMRKKLWLKHIFMQPSCFLRALNNSSTSFLPKRCQFFTKRGTTCEIYVLFPCAFPSEVKCFNLACKIHAFDHVIQSCEIF